MSHVFAALSRFRQRSRTYFSELRPSITAANLTALRRISIAFEVFLLLYGVVMSLLLKSASLGVCYAAFGVCNLPMLVCSLRYGRRPPSYRTVQLLAHGMIWMLLAFVILISVFPFPERPGIFFPMAYMLVTIPFIVRFRHLSLSLTAAALLYLALAARFKSPAAFAYDLSGTVTIWLLGFLFLYCLMDLRFRDGEARLALEQLSQTDPLTGLPNRRLLETEAATILRRCHLSHAPMAVFMLDVDHFKHYNDTMGHPAGDACLGAVGALLGSFAADQGALAIRFGGEEFVLFLPNCRPEEAEELSRALLEQIRALRLPAPNGGVVTASLGYAVLIPGPSDTCDTLIHRADSALYQAKREGRDRAVGWTPSTPLPQ